MKRFLCIVLCLVLCVSVLMPLASKADFGSFSGDSDFGGGSDHDWGSDHDYDWGDSSYSGSSGSGVYFLGGNPGFAVIVMIILVAVALARMKKNGKTTRRGAPSQRSYAPGAQRAQGLRPIGEYASIDPAFNLPGFQAKLSNLYVQMQNGWQDKNIESLRPYFTDAMFTQMNRQLDALRRSNQTNYVEKIAVLSVEVRGFRQTGGMDTIVAELRTRITDYTLNDVTGELVSGSRNAEKFMTYEWDLIRPTGTPTEKQEAMQSITCPHCGAALSINETAKCPYCDSVISVDQHDWVISAIRGISQRTQ